MKKSDELRQTQAAMIAESEGLLNNADAEKRELTADEEARFEELSKQINETHSEIAKAEKREFVEEKSAEMRASQGRKVSPAPAIRTSRKTNITNADLFYSWCGYGSDDNKRDADLMYALAERGIDPAAGKVSFRALSTGTDSAGGYTEPGGFVPQLIEKLKYFCNFRQFANVMSTPNGNHLNWPNADNTGNVAEAYTEVEEVADTGEDDPTFGEVILKRYRRSSRVIRISLDLMANTGVANFEGLLSGMLGEQLGRKQSADIGSANAGSTAPEGFWNGLTVGKTLATGNAFDWTALMDLEAALDPAYLDQPGVGYVMHPGTYAAVRKFADDNNVPLYVPSLSAGGPARTINGYPVYFCSSMTSIASPGDNQVLAVFGKLNDYVIRDIPSQSSIVRYNELYRRTGQIGLQVEAWYDARWTTKAGVVTLNSFDS